MDSAVRLDAPTINERSARCPVCGGPMSPDDVHACGRCDTRHHSDCWKWNSGCAIYGCGDRPHRPDGPRQPSGLERFTYYALFMTAVVPMCLISLPDRTLSGILSRIADGLAVIVLAAGLLTLLDRDRPV